MRWSSNGRTRRSAPTKAIVTRRRGRPLCRPVDNGCTPVVPLIRHGLRSRWQLCCLTNAAYPLRVLAPMPPSPLRGEGFGCSVRSAQMSMAFPSSVTANAVPPSPGGRLFCSLTPAPRPGSSSSKTRSSRPGCRCGRPGTGWPRGSAPPPPHTAWPRRRRTAAMASAPGRSPPPAR